MLAFEERTHGREIVEPSALNEDPFIVTHLRPENIGLFTGCTKLYIHQLQNETIKMKFYQKYGFM